MKREEFNKKLKSLTAEYEKTVKAANKKVKKSNGVFSRYVNPVITAEHVPIFWRYDLNFSTNPFLMERLGVNGTFNAGACDHNGKILLFCPRRRHRSKVFFCGRRIRQRHRQLSVLGLPGGVPGNVRPRHERL